MIRTCIICGKQFEGRANATICSGVCRLEYKRRYQIKYKSLNREKVKEQQRKSYAKNYSAAVNITSSDNIALNIAPDPKPKRKPKPKLKYRPEIFKDSQWGRDYYKSDRLVQISMLSAALSKYEIEHLSYGQLSLIDGTEKYYSYLKQVLNIKKQEERAS